MITPSGSSAPLVIDAETLPDIARHYLRAAVDSALWLARVKTAQLERAA
jgi:hypothetical protein